MYSLLATLVALSSLFTSSQALYFYLDGTSPKCFYEDLPKDTLVVGMYSLHASAPQIGGKDMQTAWKIPQASKIRRRLSDEIAVQEHTNPKPTPPKPNPSTPRPTYPSK